MTPTLTRCRARDVRIGDEVEQVGEMVDVTNVVSGANGQVYVVTESRNGTIVVVERDPGELVSVWR
ncbi:hypothetical protein JNB62_05550 [Microbacterium jejuense]|uniref:DUF4926 domain-containing protein n=1 Tax=Microbacterium jejuense TaxID=1263637 RepID=A0ABS7HJL0_9MICO|nr:hypothetical protein [Microbacterium jejuense]MBW9093141.1 hypothetical protein [Microbacterium jejuense]